MISVGLDFQALIDGTCLSAVTIQCVNHLIDKYKFSFYCVGKLILARDVLCSLKPIVLGSQASVDIFG